MIICVLKKRWINKLIKIQMNSFFKIISVILLDIKLNFLCDSGDKNYYGSFVVVLGSCYFYFESIRWIHNKYHDFSIIKFFIFKVLIFKQLNGGSLMVFQSLLTKNISFKW